MPDSMTQQINDSTAAAPLIRLKPKKGRQLIAFTELKQHRDLGHRTLFSHPPEPTTRHPIFRARGKERQENRHTGSFPERLRHALRSSSRYTAFPPCALPYALCVMPFELLPAMR